MAIEEIVNWGLSMTRQNGKVVGSGNRSVSDSLGLYHPELHPEIMPVGKTAEDRCTTCFIIHSPGQTECW